MRRTAHLLFVSGAGGYIIGDLLSAFNLTLAIVLCVVWGFFTSEIINWFTKKGN